MAELFKDISSKKRLKTNFEWDLIDKKYRNLVFECYPNISGQLSQSDAIYFWENALGYVYVRFGEDLLKKYGKTDKLLLLIAVNLKTKKIAIEPAIERLCHEWPVLYGSSEESISNLLKDVFEVGKKQNASH